MSLQRQVLDFARALAAKKRATVSGEALCRFGGAITKEDLGLIAQAIEEGCEQVNPDFGDCAWRAVFWCSQINAG